MPTARESLLAAAHAAVSHQPWTGVRMVELAASAGVSRQTLYNEFGNKDGLGRALVDDRVERFLHGVVAVAGQAARAGADPPTGLAVAAGWMLRSIGDEPIVRSALTGSWTPRTPPAARGRPGTPVQLTAQLCRRLAVALAAGTAANGNGAGAGSGYAESLHLACEAGLRLTLSYLVVPVDPGEEDEACLRVRQVTRALL